MTRSSSERDNQGISELDLPGAATPARRRSRTAVLARGRPAAAVSPAPAVRSRHWTRSIPDTVAPTIVRAELLPRGWRVDHGENQIAVVVGDAMFTLEGAAIHAAGRLACQLGPQRARAAPQHPRHVHVHRPRVLRARAADHVHAARGRAAAGVRVTQGAARSSQAEFTRRRWNFGLGVRYEWQTGIAIAPRLPRALGVSRPFRRNSRTSLRAGYGWFYGWMPARIEEETLRLSQGSTRRRDHHSRPRLSRSVWSAARAVATRSSDAAELATQRSCRGGSATSVGLDHQIRQGWRVNFDTLLRADDQRLPLARSQRAG